MSDFNDQDLKLTAAVYARHGAAEHLRKTGKLPDHIGGPWSVIPMRLIIEERGTVLTLTADEQLIYDALIREGRFPGGMVRLVSEPSHRKAKKSKKGQRKIEAKRKQKGKKIGTA